MQALVGTTINQYKIQRHLTRGGMSEIYLALDTQTQATVAIKLVHSSNIDYCKRFKHEVKTVGFLQHDHILPAFAQGDYEDWCYMVTPYIEYGTLHKKLVDGPLSFEEVGNILAQLSDALQYAHDQGIVHRDIKPTNILLHNGEHVYLADFGLVKRVGENNGLTVTGYLIGTPEYMAPELAEEPASAKSDQYALGVLLYQMLTGHVPFMANTPLGIYLKHVRERPVEPSTLNPTIPTSINDVVLRALQKEPHHRYNTVHDFAQAYKEAYAGIKNPLPIAKRQSIEAPGDKVTTQKTRSIQKRRIAYNSPLLIGAAIIFCIIPLLLGFVVSSYGSSVQHPRVQTLLLAGEQIKLSNTPTAPPTRPTSPTKNSTTPIKVQHTSLNTIPSYTEQGNNTDENGNDTSGNTHGKGHAYGHKKK